jgi:hypothetical protein
MKWMKNEIQQRYTAMNSDCKTSARTTSPNLFISSTIKFYPITYEFSFDVENTNILWIIWMDILLQLLK